MGSLYNRVRVNNPGHSFFNLSHDKKFDCDAGQLIPLDVQFCMPNDVLKFGNELVVRMNPLVAPIMHEVNVYTQYFFVPLRIMFGSMKNHTYIANGHQYTVSEWEVNDHDFETFLTGGKTGYDTSVSLPFRSSLDWFGAQDCMVHNIVEYDEDAGHNVVVTDNCVSVAAGSTLTRGFPYFYLDETYTPVWYSPSVDGEVAQQAMYTPLYLGEYVSKFGSYSLWDYMGFPVGVNPSDIHVSDFPFRAYALIWNNFFRDQILQDEVYVSNSLIVKNVCWNKDYFTAAYIDLQKGQAPALPLSNSLLPVYVDGDVASSLLGSADQLVALRGDSSSIGTDTGTILGSISSSGSIRKWDGSTYAATASAPFQVDASGLFNVNDLRLAFQVQKWLEINSTVGNHLNEFLIGHFGIGPHDETLQRPVYLGGSKSPVIVSEVLQTSSTDSTSPQGNMAGHGITADRNYVGTYRCKEYGVFMSVMYIRPKATYQQGINRAWQYETKYDFPFPEFCHLGRQAIFESEVFAQNSGNVDANGNPVIFGYTERYNELRSSHSEVCGGLRNMFDFWHLGRIFDDVPYLNSDFVKCVPDKRVFAVQSEPGFIVNAANILHAYRPIPTFGDPRT